MQDGTPVTIRPIRPEDEPLMVRFHETLSERSVYFRYFHAMRLTQRIAHERLTRICFIDYEREMALVVLQKDPITGDSEILAVGRLIKVHGTREGEFAILVSDNWHRRGLGFELLKRLVNIGREERLARIFGDILPENRDMLKICDKLGFRRHYLTKMVLFERCSNCKVWRWASRNRVTSLISPGFVSTGFSKCLEILIWI